MSGSPKHDHFHIRVDAHEGDAVRASAREYGMTVTEYFLCRCVYDDQCELVALHDAVREIYRELYRQGVNLNQIAHRMNMIGENSDGEDPRLLKMADELSGALTAVTDAITITQQALAKTILERRERPA